MASKMNELLSCITDLNLRKHSDEEKSGHKALVIYTFEKFQK
jgi:hypothetical protein